MNKITIRQEFSLMECAICSLAFAVPTDFMLRRQQDHHIFCCPNGHSNIFSTQTEEERLRKELAETKEQGRRMAIRIEQGICPCCNRTFRNLQQHMRFEALGSKVDRLKEERSEEVDPLNKIAAEVLGPLVEKLEPVVVAKIIESLDGRTALMQLEGYEITLQVSVRKEGEK